MDTTVLVPISCENLRDALKKRIAILRVEAEQERTATQDAEAQQNARIQAEYDHLNQGYPERRAQWKAAYAKWSKTPKWIRFLTRQRPPTQPSLRSVQVMAHVFYTYPKARELRETEEWLAGAETARDTCYITAELAAKLTRTTP